MADMQIQLRLTADGSGLSGTLRTASGDLRQFSTNAQQVERSATLAGAGVTRMGVQFGVAAGAGMELAKVVGRLVAEFPRLVAQQIDYAARVGETAQRLGMSTAQLSALDSVASRSGASVGTVAGALETLGKNAVAATAGAGAGAKQAQAAFAALGVSADSNIKPTSALLEEVARKLQKLPDGAFKAKIAQDLLGQSSAQLGDTLNTLATRGFAGVVDSARDMGMVVSEVAATQARQLQDGLRELRERTLGFASAVGQSGVPVLLAFAGALSDTGDKTRRASDETSALSGVFEILGRAALLVTEFLRNTGVAILALIDSASALRGVLGGMIEGLQKMGEASRAAQFGNLQGAMTAAREASNAMASATIGAAAKVKEAWGAVGASLEDSGRRLDAYQQRIEANSARLAAAAAADARVAETAARNAAAVAGTQFANVIAGARSVTVEEGKRIVASMQEQQRAMEAYKKEQERLSRQHRLTADSAREHAHASQELTRAMRDAYAAQQRIIDGNDRLDEQLARGRDVLAGLSDAQVDYAAAVRETNAQYEAALALGPPTAELQEAEAARLRKLAELRDQREAIRDYQEGQRAAMEAERDQIERSRRMWGDWADAVFDAVARSGNFLKNLLANVKSIVMQMLAEWFKTRVIGAFVGGGGGMGGLAMGAGMSLLGGGGAGGGAGGQVMGMAGNYLTGQGGIFSSGSWIDAGKNLWSGFQASYSRFMYGSGQVMPGANLFGTGIYGPGMPTTYAPTALGWGVAGAAGLYAGYNRWQNSEGGLAGGLGAAAYGLGTTGLALGVGSMMAGTGFAAGMGALGTGAAGLGAGAGVAAAIPIVGWVALAAMLVDMISGGKLFGTKFRPDSVTQSIGLSPGGGVAGVSLSEVRQGALFSGRQWRDRDLDVPPELQAAADKFFNQIQQIMVQGASRIAVDTPEMISAAIRTQQKLDKKGNVTETKYFVDLLGRTWEEASAELAAQRVSAEAIVATVAASQAGHAASEIAERWRASAEELMGGAQFLLAATEDIVKGRALLSHGSDGSGEADTLLARTTDLVETLRSGEESLGDTYARVAQDSALLQQALDLSRVSLDKTSEEFVRFAAGIEQAAGGLQQAQELWTGFFQAFYSQTETAGNQIAALRATLDQQLAAIGVDAGINMADFRATFEAALPTATADQVVQWLQAGNALAQMTQALAQLEQQAAQVLAPMGLATYGLSGFGQAIAAIKANEQAGIDAANALARAHGREGASAFELARIHDWTAKQIAAAIRRLQVETRDLVAQLYGGMPASLDAINARIAELEGGVGVIDDVVDASNNLFETWASGVKGIQDYLDSMLLGDLSALTPEEQLAEAKRQIVAAQTAALGGDATALSKLPQLSDAYLRLLRGSQASGADYNAGFDWVRQMLQAVVGMENPGTQASTPTVVAVASPELAALYAERDAALREQEDQYRAQLAQQLAQNLHDLSIMTGTAVLDMMELQGVSLDKLAADLGVDLSALTGDTVLALGNLATTLGLPLADLTSALNVSLTDLAGGVTELSTRLGIDLSAMTVESTQMLAALANSLNADLTDLAASVGVDLGGLADSQSLMTQALAATIDSLAPDVRDQLAPLLEAISAATSEADATTAVGALSDAVNALAPDIRDLLAPYLQGVTRPDALTDLDYLSSLQDIGRDQLDVLRDIARGLNVPGYAVGTGYVPRTGLAMIHEGEAILPAPVAAWMRSAGFPVADGGSSPALLAELRALRTELADLRRATRDGSDKVAGSIDRADARAQAQRDEIARNTRGDTSRSRMYG